MSTWPQIAVDFQIDVKGIDLDRLEEEFEKSVADSMNKFASAIDESWRKIASSELNTTKDKYLKGLTVEKTGPDTVTGTLEGFLPVALEDGAQRFDIKKKMLQGHPLGRIIPLGKSSGLPPKFVAMTPGHPGWWHPGFEARAIHKKVQKEIEEQIASDVFGESFSRIKV